MTDTASNFITDPIFPECPVRNILARIAGKWALLILITLDKKADGMRFSELAKAIPDISQRMLSTTLRSLEADGLVSRKAYPEVPPRVEYTLTERAHTLIPLVDSLVDWSLENYKDIMEDRRRFDKNK
ncbi:helix-turn-helix domain-containing protein [Prevotella sp. KH2C16]|uniref:winged helix-turn-helix transcriptional regulator n=1 Tax=Prevotella sp. KH2C16 TaxID=1855325 RepID=UPI0008E179BB|nr:helix-turn-helix domain-containing protein [Prevotella sp. KH2C16]SFG17004.1 DNA-binding transcriptional regulator, HxlR family [Prevotella sp. KH2C16]